MADSSIKIWTRSDSSQDQESPSAVEIRHRYTRKVLARIEAPSMEGTNLQRRDLRCADLRDMVLHNIDFSGAILADADFSGARILQCNLSGCMLVGASLCGAFVFDSRFVRSNLHGTDFRLARLSQVNFSEADLRMTDMRGAHFQTVNLGSARLDEAVLRRTAFFESDFRAATLTDASIGDTVFGCCAHLHYARGLHRIVHSGPSWPDLQTLRMGVSNLPDTFLLGVGLTRREIDELKSLYPAPTPFPSYYLWHEGVFELSDRLRSDLSRHNIACWSRAAGAPVRKLEKPARDAGRRDDRLILVCSKRCLLHPATATEVLAAIEAERETRQQKLFPLRVDDFILSDEMTVIADTMMESKVWHTDWIHYLRAHGMPDFNGWRNPHIYQASFNRLLKLLTAPGRR